MEHYSAELFKDARGEWRWHVKASNGQIVACSGEGYHNRGDCKGMVKTLFPSMDIEGAAIVETRKDPETGEITNVSPSLLTVCRRCGEMTVDVDGDVMSVGRCESCSKIFAAIAMYQDVKGVQLCRACYEETPEGRGGLSSQG